MKKLFIFKEISFDTQWVSKEFEFILQWALLFWKKNAHSYRHFVFKNTHLLCTTYYALGEYLQNTLEKVAEVLPYLWLHLKSNI